MKHQQPVQITDLHQLAPKVRDCIKHALAPLVGDPALTYDFYREWSGGWRVRVDVEGRGRLDFALFHTPQGALLALPIPMPERWRVGTGIAADDGSLWTLDDAGQLVPF